MNSSRRHYFGEVVRNETGKTAVKVDVDASWPREVTITLETGKRSVSMKLYDFDPDTSEALGDLFKELAEWQWQTEEANYEEYKHDLHTEPEEPPLFYTYTKKF